MTIVFKLFVHSPQAENCVNFLCSFTLTHLVPSPSRSTLAIQKFSSNLGLKKPVSILACPTTIPAM